MLPTMRDEFPIDDLPVGLQAALVNFDHYRQQFGYEAADAIAQDKWGCPAVKKVFSGLRKISLRGMTRIATKHSHVCPVYCRQHSDTLRSLSGLFYWTGPAEVRRRLLLLAWRKGRYPARQMNEGGGNG
ncbi:hypothetical protein [Thalassobaculum litoreum]|uniref:Uncharacterized protein n=1 Tax=Thalassobaculum litoreum DSM 18839 TaxID=1123362 RepID=A0A8G2EWJ2_9PROT|nr:hypothetical protein [Thalassobaculum litoreum]SDF84401.1 hypothetical protein SAMN05660686_02509 [Thalassobaculum litoreum DSM 18839]